MTNDDAETLETTPVLDFPVVGIGASAGGLEAVTDMFRNIDKGTGMAFVLVMHLDPDHESLMAELLARKVRVDVKQITDKDTLEVDCLHVIPPGSSLHMDGGILRLEAFSEPRGIRRPIDSFFISLAHAQGHMAASVVLSGTGADGTAGLRIVKEYGGILAVQTPEEARYDGMPFSAISTKAVDFILPAPEIVPRLKAFFEGADQSRLPTEEESENVMQEITKVIYKQIGHDFSGYKRSTLVRRLFRRLQVLEFQKPEEYLEFLRTDANEQAALAQDFLINVTSFFRDRENFEVMRQKVIRPLIEGKDSSDEVRIWIPGCSSGQEAYSVAMMVDETCEELRSRPLIQIFATDIDRTMITQGRKAQYAVASFGEIPKRYQEKYTTGLDGKFEIIKRIREMVRFSIHNVIQDPPFSKIDLISCRNLLIYLGEDLQKELFPLLHFSLKPGGILFLGNSENVTRRGELFSIIDQHSRIFRRQNLDKRLQIHLPLGTRNRGLSPQRKSQKLENAKDFPRHRSLDASNLTIYEQYAPPFVRVSRDGRILDSSGDLSLFLMSRPGEERDLGALARSEVRNVVLPLIADAIEEDRRRAIKEIEVTTPFGILTTDIIAHPMRDDTVAVIFLAKDQLKPILDKYEHVPVTSDRRIADLQDELQTNRLLLKSKVEEIETANEELKSSNEEMMSMNEELQSANEELTTANEELKNKIDELTLANADLDNFMKSADLAIIVLDPLLRVRHVTEAARAVVPVTMADQGRSLAEFNVSFDGFDLLGAIRKVIKTGTPFEHTTDLNEKEEAFIIRITPYLLSEGLVDGASVTIVDISREVRLRHQISRDAAVLDLAMQSSRMGYLELDTETRAATIDKVAASQMGLEGPGTYPIAEAFRNWHADDAERAEGVREAAIKDGKNYTVDYRVIDSDQQTHWYRAHAARLNEADPNPKYAMITIDMTDEVALRNSLSVESDRLKLVMKAGRMGFAEIDVGGEMVTVDAQLADQFGLANAGEISLDTLRDHIVSEDLDILKASLGRAIDQNEEFEFDFRVKGSRGQERWMRTRGMPYLAADGRQRVIGPTLDITAEKLTIRHQETLVRELSHRIKNLFTVVSSLVQSAPKANEHVEDFADELVGRIVAIGRANDLARMDHLDGTNLRNMLETVVLPHAAGHAVRFDGPNVDVAEQNVSILSLVLHELATNATKHGAFAATNGEVDVKWDQGKGEDIVLKWTETVPDFIAEEAEPGFGTRLVDIGVKQMRGTITRQFHKTGISVEMTLRLGQQTKK